MTEEDKLHMELIEHDCLIDTNDIIEYPPVAISIGETYIHTKDGKKKLPVPIGTYGNFSFVQAPPKTSKTFFISLIASVYMGGRNTFGGDLRGHREDKCLIHFDTEQGKYHAQRVFRRVVDMNDNKNEGCYHTFGLRAVGSKSRLKFIEWYLTNRIEKGKVGLVIIDGIADLVTDVNNISESNEVVQKIMEFSQNFNCHIMTVIHSNYGSEKPTGHLGSFLEKKTETQIQLETNTTNKGWITVKCKRSRGYSFDTFSFKINEIGLPEIIGNLYNPLKNVAF
tara:strand:- start:8857 stop:9699 length:843 start_codon:yes stop_codon:yes gene_type:complete